MVKKDVDEKKVEAVIDEELQRLLADGPTADELAQAKTMFRAGFIRGVERIGGFGGKVDVLAACETYTGEPDCYQDVLRDIQAATREQSSEEHTSELQSLMRISYAVFCLQKKKN